LSVAAGRPEFNPVAIAAVIAAAVMLLSFGFWISLGAIVILGLVAGAMAYWVMRMLGGQTGDVLGAFQQVSEVTIILAVAAAGSG